MPVPSGSRSSRRIGNGFQISNTRKSIRPARKVFQASGTAMSVTSCPATSSMTTNCGSFKPAPRATNVAAGIPMMVTAAAAMIVAQLRLAAGIRQMINAHTITVNVDPQVPGPGLRRPAPKNVATSAAPKAALVPGWRPGEPPSVAILVVEPVLPYCLVGVGNRGRNHVPAARPLAEIDQAAAVTAKREVRVGRLHLLLADRAAEFEGRLARHIGLRRSEVRL